MSDELVTGSILGEDEERDPMLKIPFARLGEWRHPVYKTVKVTEDTFAQMLANFYAGHPGSKPFVRIGHDIPFNKTAFGDTPALAWVESLTREGDILYALARPTSFEATWLIRTKQYRYSSMEADFDFTPRDKGAKKVGATLLAVALTNQPHLTHLPEAQVVLSQGGPEFFALDYGAATEESMANENPAAEAAQETPEVEKTQELAAAESNPATEETPAVVTASATEEATAQLSTLQEQIAAARLELAEARSAAHGERVQATVEKYVRLGVPPVLVHAVKPLLLACADQGPIMLASADGAESEAPAFDAIVAVLEAYPADKRVSFSQAGEVESTQGAEDREAQDKAALEARVKADAERVKRPGMVLAN